MKKKICVVGPCVNMGGIERASATIANYFSEEGHSVLYLAIFRHRRFFNLNPEVIYDEPLDGTNVKSMNIVKTVARIRRILKSYDPDTVLAYNKFYAALTLIAGIGLGKKIYISERSSPFYKWPQRLEIINRIAFILNPPTGIIAQTAIAAQYQQKKLSPKTKVAIIPNALRKVTLYPEIKREKWILAVGRLNDRLKGFDRLVDAYAKTQNQDWKLVFAGGDENAVLLKQKAQELGVLDNVIFLGKVENIDRVYAQASIFVIPSLSEGFPNALCEAMGAGLPCISFDFIAGPRDIITDGVDGVIVPDGDIEAMADAISKLTADGDRRTFLGNNARQIVNRLDEKIIGRKALDFILS